MVGPGGGGPGRKVGVNEWCALHETREWWATCIFAGLFFYHDALGRAVMIMMHLQARAVYSCSWHSLHRVHHIGVDQASAGTLAAAPMCNVSSSTGLKQCATSVCTPHPHRTLPH